MLHIKCPCVELVCPIRSLSIITYLDLPFSDPNSIMVMLGMFVLLRFLTLILYSPSNLYSTILKILTGLIFYGKFPRNIPIALTLKVQPPENFIILSLIMAIRPQNHPPFKRLCIYVGGGVDCNFVGALQAAKINRLP